MLNKRFIRAIAIVSFVALAGAGVSHAETDTMSAPKDRIELEKQSIFIGEVKDLKKELPVAKATFQKADLLHRNLANHMTFKSMDKDIALINRNGVVHGRKCGETKALCTYTVSAGHGKTKKIECYLPIVVEKEGMVYPDAMMMEGEELSLAFTDHETTGTWESMDNSIAAVYDDGKVSAKKEGDVLLKGTTEDRTYLCRLHVNKKVEDVIYLTFDDGPSRSSTPRILDILKRHDVKATFFEINPADADLDLTKRIVEEGHTLAIHGYSHEYHDIYESEEAYRENIDKLRDKFLDITGKWVNITRFPGGSSNTISHFNPGVMSRLSERLPEWGYSYYDWNVSSGDAGGAKNSYDVYASVIREIERGNTNIVLMHDFSGNEKTIGALEDVIEYGEENGYTFLPITPSTPVVHHPILN